MPYYSSDLSSVACSKATNCDFGGGFSGSIIGGGAYVKGEQGKITFWNETVSPAATGFLTISGQAKSSSTVRIVLKGQFPPGVKLALQITEKLGAWKTLDAPASEVSLDAPGSEWPGNVNVQFDGLVKGASMTIDSLALFSL